MSQEHSEQQLVKTPVSIERIPEHVDAALSDASETAPNAAAGLLQLAGLVPQRLTASAARSAGQG